ncbi:hypothetical protein MRB53_011321 [Persea americana]|uniref:Uncharacterized protein n=1 Tax=Persea americana TaxID=3435 RepID=A0ACC2LUP8_PERAE|nr:hypothetical protein MRB53_011321 [Persea americana]
MDEHKTCFKKTIQKMFGMSKIVSERNAAAVNEVENCFRAYRLGELNDHALRAPNPDDEVGAVGLEGLAEVCDGFSVNDIGAGVKAEEGEEGEGVGVDDGGRCTCRWRKRKRLQMTSRSRSRRKSRDRDEAGILLGINRSTSPMDGLKTVIHFISKQLTRMQTGACSYR